MKLEAFVLFSLPLITTTASADCVVFLEPIEVPFSGVNLPANAEMRLIDPRLDPITLTLPDGAVREFDVVSDEVGAVVALPDDLQPLPVGAYQFNIFNITGTFNVTETIDDSAPDPPVVTVTRDSSFTPPSLWPYEECPREVGNHYSATFTVDGTQAGDVVILDGVAAVAATDGTTTFSKTQPTGSGSFELRLRDAAGNESDVTTTDAGGGCGGCAAADASIATSLALVGLVVRLRGTSRSTRATTTSR
jgi:hypothetical protein